MPDNNGTAPAQVATSDVVAELQRLTDEWLGAAEQTVAAAQPVVTAVFVSNVTPPLPLGGAGDGLGSKLVNLIRPGIVGTLPLVGAVNVAPYGPPTPGVGTVVFVAVLGLAGYGLYKLLRR